MSFGSSAPAVSAASGPSTATQGLRVLPTTQANAAARAGGGLSPNFVANMVSQQTGGQGGLEILEQIRQGLGQA